MALLRNGGSAADAVEMAVRVLEDAEITNSGYGSNLSLDGTVECDAVIMEAGGLSGAVGAVSRKSTSASAGPNTKLIEVLQMFKTQYLLHELFLKMHVNLFLSKGSHRYFWLAKGRRSLPGSITFHSSKTKS